MKRIGIIAVGVLLSATLGGTLAVKSDAGRLPPPARADCGGSGVAGAGFTVYSCASGAGGTRYAHPAELLVVRADGGYTGHRDAFSQPNLVSKSSSGEIVAAHNDAIVQVTAYAVTALVDERLIARLLPHNRGLAAINALTIKANGDIFFHANYYARDRRGCANIRAERTSPGRLIVLWRSAPGQSCG